MINDRWCPLYGSRVFVSYAGPDRAWAEWVAWQLEAAEYPVELDLWDWPVGDSFVARMRQALDDAEVVVALWSAAYFSPERFALPEWEAAFAVRDGSGPRLVPLRVEPVTPPMLLRPLLRTDLFGLSVEAARAALLDALRETGRSGREPPLPTSSPPATLALGPRLPGALPEVWNVPVRLAAFTGRDHILVDLRRRLCAGGPVAVQALQGQGGIGKTQVAIEYAYRFANAYELVWWVDAEKPNLIGEHMAALAVAMRVAEAGAPIPVAVTKVMARLRTTPGWLLVFDNATEPEELLPWVPVGPGQTLVTSRHGHWREVAADCVEVDVFSRAESVGLLRRLAPSVSGVDAALIAERLGDLPLAVAQAAGVLAEIPISARHYLTELARHAAAVMDEGRSVAYPRTLAATLRLSLDRLATSDPAALHLLRICAMLAPEPIPLELFNAVPRHGLPPPLDEAVAAPMAFGRTVGRLVRYALAKRTTDQTGVAEGLLVHRLTQDVVRDLLDDDRRCAVRSQAETLIIAAQPVDPNDPERWPRWAALLPHLLALDPATTDNPGLRLFAVQATWFVLARGDLTAGQLLAEELFTAWRDRLGRDHDHTLQAAHNLARAYRDGGQYQEAYRLTADTYTRRREVFGGNHPGTLNSAAALGIDLYQAGEYQLARELDEDTYARRRRVLGEDHPDTLISANNLVVDLRQAGEYEQARHLVLDTYIRCRRVFGDDHPRTLAAAHNLAECRRQAGEYERARELEEDTYARRQRVLGDHHPRTLDSAHNLAEDLRQAGEYERARQLQEQTFTRRRTVLGDAHPDTVTSATNLAGGPQILGRTDEVE